MNTKSFSTTTGFTLVELMVVVAIIGILTAIAVPNFKRYQAKARTSEAKMQLSALYTGEQGFYTDYNTYATCLDVIGYDPRGEYLNRYYAVGFKVGASSAANTAAVTNGANATCKAADSSCEDATCSTSAAPYTNYLAGKNMSAKIQLTKGEFDTLSAAALIPDPAGAVYTFLALAAGYISPNKVGAPATDADQWTIDQNKSLKETAIGY